MKPSTAFSWLAGFYGALFMLLLQVPGDSRTLGLERALLFGGLVLAVCFALKPKD